MSHDLEVIWGWGFPPRAQYIICRKCGKTAKTRDGFSSDCDVVTQNASKTLAQRMEEKQKMEIQNVEKLTWEVEVEPDGNSAWVRLRIGEKSEAYVHTKRRFFGTLKAAIDRAKNKILHARNLAKAESGPVYVPYQPRK